MVVVVVVVKVVVVVVVKVVRKKNHSNTCAFRLLHLNLPAMFGEKSFLCTRWSQWGSKAWHERPVQQETVLRLFKTFTK